MTDIEIWKPVPSYPQIMASSWGRIIMPSRTVTMPNGGQRRYETKPIIGCLSRSKKGAKHVYRGTWPRYFGNLKIHRLVCEAFHGPCPPGLETIHLDEDGLNNRADNLCWGTRKANLNMPKFKEYCRNRS